MVIEQSTITGNTAFLEGGGIRSSGHLTITQSSLTMNVSQTDGGAIHHGDTHYLGETLTVHDSLIAGNQAAGAGGGIVADGVEVQQFTNITLSSNRAGATGGGVVVRTGESTLTHATLIGNQAPEGESLSVGTDGTLTLAGSIMAGPSGGANCTLASGGVLHSAGANIASDSSCALTGPGDLPATDPLLGALAYNGGATFTHLPQPGQPGHQPRTAGWLSTYRSTWFVCPVGAACDSGAVEVGASAPTPSPTAPPTLTATPTTAPPSPTPTATPTLAPCPPRSSRRSPLTPSRPPCRSSRCPQLRG